MIRNRHGQTLAEFLIYLPVGLLVASLLFTLVARICLKHFLWVDLVTLHRARLYDPNTPCQPHSFWPESYRARIQVRCAADSTAIRYASDSTREEFGIRADYSR